MCSGRRVYVFLDYHLSAEIEERFGKLCVFNFWEEVLRGRHKAGSSEDCSSTKLFRALKTYFVRVKSSHSSIYFLIFSDG